MNFAPVQRSLLWNGLGLLLALVAVGLMALVELPQLRSQRTSIDATRATIQLEAERQNNLQAVAKQLADLHDQQTAFDTQIWKFADEEKFFALWSDLARQTSTTIADPIVTDATPNAAPVQRTASLTVTGSIANILAAISAIQKLTPVVAINSVALRQGILVGQARADIEASTVWN